MCKQSQTSKAQVNTKSIDLKAQENILYETKIRGNSKKQKNVDSKVSFENSPLKIQDIKKVPQSF